MVLSTNLFKLISVAKRQLTSLIFNRFLLCALLFIFAPCGFLHAQAITTPKEHFGFNIGDNYQLANYTQTEAYFKKVAAESNRVIIEEIGKTEEGRSQYILIISSPENLAQIDQYKSISHKMARAKVGEAEAKELAETGKPVVWIDGGLHANEVVATHQLIELYHQLTSRNDKETKRILDRVIILLSQVNPDGQELMSNWFMSEKDEKKRNFNIPRLYQKYAGHDNNRDFYMNNLKETENISRQQYIEWMPQIIYNHHQSAPAGAIVAGPPYRDPFNFVIDPLLITGIDGVGAAMINRLNSEDKPGFTRLSGSPYSTWWNGGLRTTPYFHNMIGILTETTGSPWPTEIPVISKRLMPDNGTPYPVTPQSWNFRKSIDYSVSMSYAVLDYAARNGDHLLYNIYKMGKNSIEKGSSDHWSLQPKNIDSLQRLYERDREGKNVGSRIPPKYYDSVFKDPQLRDARGYIINADQADFATAIKFVNALIKSGIEVQRATDGFEVHGKKYAKGSFIVKTAQAFRPHVLDMFDPQDHPNDFQYPGGPPVRPYDAAGWTLAYQMGVEFDRILDGFEGPFETLPFGELIALQTFDIPIAKEGYILNAAENNSYLVVNKLLRKGAQVFRIGHDIPQGVSGSFYIPRKYLPLLKAAITNTNVQPQAVNRPAKLKKISALKIGLYDYYGGSMQSGWTRFILEQFEFDYEVVYPKQLDEGNLNKKFDVILFIGNGIPDVGKSAGRQIKADDVPKEYHKLLGTVTEDKTIPELKKFIENGGVIVTTGSSTALAYHFDLPVKNALMKISGKGEVGPLSSNDYFIPGSVLEANINPELPAAFGMRSSAYVLFNHSPVFQLTAAAVSQGVEPIAWYQNKNVLASGWAWGQEYIRDGVAAFAAPVGKGKLYCFGPEITFRGQSHGTFKLLFNQLYK